MSMNVAMGRGKEAVRLGSAEAKVFEPALRETSLSKQCGSVTVLAELALGGGLGDGNGAV
jgi:hypothetical protein